MSANPGTSEEIEELENSTENPWLVENIQAFSFLNCPECAFKVKEVGIFQDHAVRNHPQSSVLFGPNVKSEFIAVKTEQNSEISVEHPIIDPLESVMNQECAFTEIETEEVCPIAMDEQSVNQTETLSKNLDQEMMDISKAPEPVKKKVVINATIELLVDGKIPAKKPMPLKKVFPKGFPCSYCPKKFSQKNNLRVHMKEKHKEQLLQWYKKNSGSPNPMKMSNDQNPSNAKVNESSKGIFPCTYCNGKFTQKNDLREHMKQKHREQLLQWAKSGSPNPKKMPNDQTSSMETKKVNEISKDSKKVSPIMEKSDVVEYQLPYGWKKVGSRRSDSADRDRWDFYVYGPNGEKFRSNVEIKKYLDMNPEVQCDLDVTNTSRIKNSHNDQSRELLKTN